MIHPFRGYTTALKTKNEENITPHPPPSIADWGG
jgi:hypothetical protein